MPLEHPDFLKNNPYYDDFSEEKDFLRILFKPGYGIQARELTQLQTTLQNQTSRFADHVFKEGSKVFGGNVNTAKVTYLRIEKFRVLPVGSSYSFSQSSSDDYLETLKTNPNDDYISNDSDSTYTGSIDHVELEVYLPDGNNDYDFTTSSTTVRLVHFLKSGHSENDDYTILLLNTVSGNESLSFGAILKIKNQDVYFKVIDKQVFTNTNINKLQAFGSATLVSVESGIYYTNGFFVRNNRQHFCPFYNSLEGQTEETLLNNQLYTGAMPDVRLFTFISSRVGFYVDKTTIDIQDDATLADPANGFYNDNAPGADRYKINLILSSYVFNEESVDLENYANKDFIQLVKIVRGEIDWIRKLTSYSEILDLLARRTHDESGSYTTRPFVMQVKNHLRRDTFELLVQNSPTNNFDNQFLETTGYIWSTTDINGDPPTLPQGFPYSIDDFSEFNFSVAKIVEITAAKEEDNINVTSATSYSKRIRIQPLNNVRFSFNPSAFQTFNYVKSSVSNNTTISAKYIKFITDSDGVYSVYDTPKGDENKSVLTLSAGKAYVYGYEKDFTNIINLEYDKGRNTNIDTISELATLSSSSFLGNYVIGGFVQDTLSYTIDTNIDWETLPKFELQSEDIFTLIMRTGDTEKAQGKIRSWSPFSPIATPEQEKRKMFGAEDSSQEYESVILITDP